MLMLSSVLGIVQAQAFTITLDSGDFGVTPAFSSVTNFHFVIEVDEPFQAGTTYNNPTLTLVDYNIGGSLAPGTPSGFPAFSLVRSMNGTEFYAQGSSLNFTIGAGADLSDGLQLSELTGTNPVFVLNAREFDTGRYHPTHLVLNLDGTGVAQNSNNSGPTTTNPATGELVDVDFGEEYISNLSFNPSTTTIGVPEPSTLLLLLSGLALTRRSRRPGVDERVAGKERTPRKRVAAGDLKR